MRPTSPRKFGGAASDPTHRRKHSVKIVHRVTLTPIRRDLFGAGRVEAKVNAVNAATAALQDVVNMTHACVQLAIEILREENRISSNPKIEKLIRDLQNLPWPAKGANTVEALSGSIRSEPETLYGVTLPGQRRGIAGQIEELLKPLAKEDDDKPGRAARKTILESLWKAGVTIEAVRLLDHQNREFITVWNMDNKNVAALNVVAEELNQARLRLPAEVVAQRLEDASERLVTDPGLTKTVTGLPKIPSLVVDRTSTASTRLPPLVAATGAASHGATGVLPPASPSVAARLDFGSTLPAATFPGLPVHDADDNESVASEFEGEDDATPAPPPVIPPVVPRPAPKPAEEKIHWKKIDALSGDVPLRAEPSKSVKVTAYAPVKFRGKWSPDRANNLKVIDGVYEGEDIVGTDGSEIGLEKRADIEGTLLQIVKLAAIKAGMKTPDEVYAAIDSAKGKGGVTNRVKGEDESLDGKRYLKDNPTTDEIDKESPEYRAKFFSRQFQLLCRDCGIYSGRGGFSFGLRLAFLSPDVEKKLTPEFLSDLSEEEAKASAIAHIAKKTEKVASVISSGVTV